MRRAWRAAALMMAAAAPAGAQTVQAGPLTLDFSGRAQVQFHTTSVGEDDLGAAAPAATAFETRRLYFGVNFAFEEWITGELEADLAGAAPELTDGFIQLAFSDALAVRAGQFKKPFGLIELTSNTQTPMIERSLRLRGVPALVGVVGEEQWLLASSMYVGRQIGVEVHGERGRLGYAVGVFNGEGQNEAETESSKAWAGRLTWALEEPAPLVLGGGVSVQPTGVFDAAGDEILAVAWSVDGEYGGFRVPGPRVLAELMVGDDPLLIAGGEAPTMLGAHVVGSWFLPREGRVEGLEPLLRVSWADPSTDADDDAGLLLTPGVNAYFSGRNRLQLNGELHFPSQAGLDPEYGLLAQLQIYF